MQDTLKPSLELLKKCQEGNRSAFNELFHMYKSYAYNLVYKITGPYVAHEDLVQEVFFQIYLSLKSFKGNSSFKTWFHRIVIHVCTKQWRYQNTGKRISPKDTVPFDEFEYSLPAGEDADRQHELQDTVERALATLNEGLRVPLVMHIYSEMSLTEISETMGIPEGTVKSRLFSARKLIKDFLNGCNS
jgi:RNA polymerase sigma factor (sigma-70 family)